MPYVVIERSKFNTEVYCFENKETAYEFREKRDEVVVDHVSLHVEHGHVYDSVEDAPVDVFAEDEDGMTENDPYKNIAEIFDCEEEFIEQMAEIAFAMEESEE